MRTIILLLCLITVTYAFSPAYRDYPDYDYDDVTCYGFPCPSNTVNCKKHSQTENSRRIHVEIYCLDSYGNSLNTHVRHERNFRNGFFHIDTYALPVGNYINGCSNCYSRSEISVPTKTKVGE